MENKTTSKQEIRFAEENEGWTDGFMLDLIAEFLDEKGLAEELGKFLTKQAILFTQAQDGG